MSSLEVPTPLTLPPFCRFQRFLPTRCIYFRPTGSKSGSSEIFPLPTNYALDVNQWIEREARRKFAHTIICRPTFGLSRVRINVFISYVGSSFRSSSLKDGERLFWLTSLRDGSSVAPWVLCSFMRGACRGADVRNVALHGAFLIHIVNRNERDDMGENMVEKEAYGACGHLLACADSRHTSHHGPSNDDDDLATLCTYLKWSS